VPDAAESYDRLDAAAAPSVADLLLSEAARQRLHDDVLARLTAFRPGDAAAAAQRDRTLDFLAAHPRAVDGTYPPGHVTATGLVLSADRRRVLLTLHARIGRWLELGGHLEESDAGIPDAALREATEEGGIDGLTIAPDLFAVVVHENLPCRRAPGTDHYDVYFRLFAPPQAQPVISAESLDLAFFDVNRLPEPLGEGVADMVRLAVSAP
jgi:8-oxo-dGTP pyrophosphatase MutT (NUDIX family)